MRVRQIPILRDNYSHLVIDDVAGVAAAIDPAEPAPVLSALEEESVRLTHVLCTHHHWDHTGGNLELLEAWPDADVVGSAADSARIPGITRPVDDGDTLQVGRIAGRVLFVPCHTRGHLAYLFEDALFCGDTLFVAGCGRFTEGDAAQMDHALNAVFGSLPDETRVYCGHEYTVTNLKFAQTIEPENDAIRRKLKWAEARRDEGRSTVPSTLGEERTYNPFMRVRVPSVAQATGETDPVRVMASLRARKDRFRA